jgi:hypothetical protein
MGNHYKATGKWISWEDLKRKHPLAVIDPPSLEEYTNRSGNVGRGDKLESGGLPKAEKKFKVVKRKKDMPPTAATSNLGDAWTGGSSQSIHATSSTLGSDHAPSRASTNVADTIRHGEDDSLEPDQDGWFGGSSLPASSSQTKITKDKESHGLGVHPDNLGVTAAPIRQLRKSRSGLSLSERLGMDDIKEASNAEPMPSFNGDEKIATKTGKQSKPPHLKLANLAQDSAIGRLSSPMAQTPLSAHHSPPETPLKHIGRGANKRADLPSTPGSEQAVYDATLQHAGSNRVGGLLLESEGDSPVFPKELQTPKRDNIALSAMSNSSSSSHTNESQTQIDAMLAKLKLARTGAVAGTQESRWAVKEPETTIKADEGFAVQAKPEEKHSPKPIVKQPVVQKSVVSQAATPTIPTAPRALREKIVAREISPPAKSLLERMTTAGEGESSAPAREKKDRKRGGRKAEVFPEPPIANGKDKAKDKPPSKTGRNPPGEASQPPKSPVILKQPEEHPPAPEQQAVDELPPMSLAPSASAASISTNHTTEGSNVGNDTWGTINWADDDDDLPDLPEEWMRTANLAASDGVKGEESSSSTVIPSAAETRPNNHPNANAQRGAKRGGRGRGKKERRDAYPPRGIKIAGSAVQAATKEAAKAPKELFPLHKQDNAPRGGNNNNNSLREQRPHGRPKLIQSNKDTFGRLTKGALGVSTAAPSPVTGPGQAPARRG